MQRRTFLQVTSGFFSALVVKIAFWRSPLRLTPPPKPVFKYLETKNFEQTVTVVEAFEKVELGSTEAIGWDLDNRMMALPVMVERDPEVDVGYVVGRVLSLANPGPTNITSDTILKEAMRKAGDPDWSSNPREIPEAFVWNDADFSFESPHEEFWQRMAEDLKNRV